METVFFVIIWIGGAVLHTAIELTAKKTFVVRLSSGENRKKKSVR